MASFFSKLLGGSSGLKRYELIDQIARGGFSTVYRAKDRETGKIVAVKILNLDAMEVAERLQKAYHKWEGEIALMLKHPNIVETYEFGFDKNQHYIAMEYVDGPHLKYLVTTQDSLWRENRLHIILQMGAGLAYIHDKELIHRDFCPKNVLMKSDGTPKIIDFGLCIPRRRKKRWKWDRSGTPSYMAPEQIRGQSVDVRGDIYAFGVSMYEVLVGKRPFRESPTREGKMQPHLNIDPPPPSMHDPTLTPEVDKVCLRAMEKNRDRRYQTMDQLLSEFRAAIETLRGKEGWDV